MKMIFKLVLLAITIIGCGATMQADYNGMNSRIDHYFGGERVGSSYPETYSGNILFQTTIGPNNEIGVFGIRDVTEIRFVPYGVNSYPAHFINENPDEVEVKYDIISDNNVSERKGVAPKCVPIQEDDEILSGKKLRVWVRVPEGSYPAVSIAYEYSAFQFGEQYWKICSAMPQARLVNLDIQYPCIMDQRKTYLESVTEISYFERSDTDPNLWFMDMYMPNEPISLKFYNERPDSMILRGSTMKALSTLVYYGRGYGSNNFILPTCAEPYVMSLFGDFISQDFISGFLTTYSINIYDFGLIYAGMEGFLHSDYKLCAGPWEIYMREIAYANLLLSQIDKFTDATQQERDQSKAQMLALRSYAYFRLLQLYGNRWCDSNNGSSLCAPLETYFNIENLPMSSMREIIDQCYQDLDEALGIMQRTDFTRSDILQPDINTVRGIKMRIAMLCEDWFSVKELAEQILEATPLTTNTELKSGFFKPGESWIWGVGNYFNITEDIIYNQGYTAFDKFNACNGSGYPVVWGFPPNSIDKDLYMSMAQNDVRKSLFVMPDVLPEYLPDGMSTWDFWHNNDNINCDDITLLRGTEDLKDYYNQTQIVPEGVYYSAFYGSEFRKIQYGAQTKFYTPDVNLNAESALVLMRSEEVLLSEAEACFRLGDEAKALELLNRLNSIRCPEYVFAARGEELLKEIQRTRKVELWGEGHSWFDQKRWNLPISRRTWIAGDIHSGNWSYHITHDITQNQNISTDYANGWRLPIPYSYLIYNPLVDINQMNYSGISGYEKVSGSIKRNVNRKSSGPRYQMHTDILIPHPETNFMSR